ncbi:MULTISPECIES: EF-hand domain-containing protein [unclassified Streptomyces]|uniref:EF-hand domain-containing protein n=1 Tax=unclassified Streptomyces TaxID=2593676 RepID=UPI0022524C42|nr:MULTISPECIES: EF-hand domain-containing protein [unclassified Streptomyces]MCX5328191.1 EF-hand domain-containing protein [Streptomyces sp. NBC_00140]MCX5357599.1 EF-hand domain-containing protein [Streptomyces sp. NBC_00124]
MASFAQPFEGHRETTTTDPGRLTGVGTVLTRKAGMDDSQRAYAESEARRLFYKIDTDHDGLLTVYEVVDYADAHNPLGQRAVQEAFDGFFTADTDKNQSLTEEEFVQHYVKSRACPAGPSCSG